MAQIETQTTEEIKQSDHADTIQDIDSVQDDIDDDTKYEWNEALKGYDKYIPWEKIPKHRIRNEKLCEWEFTPGSSIRFPWRAINWDSKKLKYVQQKHESRSLEELHDSAQQLCEGFVEARVTVKQEMAAISTFLAGFSIGYVFDIDEETFNSNYSNNDDTNIIIDNIFFSLYCYSIIISSISLLFNAASCIKFVSDVQYWVGEGQYMSAHDHGTFYPSHLAAYAFQKNKGVSNLGWITFNQYYVDSIDKSFLYGIVFFMLAMIFSFFGKGMDLWIAIPSSILILWVTAIIYKMWNRKASYGVHG